MREAGLTGMQEAFCVLTTSEESLQWQLALVKAFVDENFLRLNLSKCGGRESHFAIAHSA